jgi:hypothetical protein
VGYGKDLDDRAALRLIDTLPAVCEPLTTLPSADFLHGRPK